jgi:hypothetical protein
VIGGKSCQIRKSRNREIIGEMGTDVINDAIDVLAVEIRLRCGGCRGEIQEASLRDLFMEEVSSA